MTSSVPAEAPVDVVIVNWNAGELLSDCIRSITAHGQSVGRIIVVDNDSSDGSDRVEHLDPRVEVVRNGRNLGFGTACNIGVARSTAPYVLFLNPDTRLLEGTVDAALAEMGADDCKDVGILGVRLLDESGATAKTCARFPTPLTYVGAATGLSKILPRLFKPHFMTDFTHLEDRDVDQVMGAFMLVRREVLAVTGGFDERFFVYFEDVDFCLRARQAGWRVRHYAGAAAYHRGCGTTDQVKPQRLNYSLGSRIQYAGKHFGPIGYVTVLAATLALEPGARVLAGLARGSREDVGNTTRGVRLLYSRLPEVMGRNRRAR